MSDTPLQVAVEAARAAGRILKERADSVGKIQYKGEIDPVTEIDSAVRTGSHRHNPKSVSGSRVSRRGVRHDGRRRRSFVDHRSARRHGELCARLSLLLCVDRLPVQGRGGGGRGLQSLSRRIVRRRERAGRNPQRQTDCRFTTDRSEDRACWQPGFPTTSTNRPTTTSTISRNFITACQAIRRPGSAAMDLCYTAMGRFEGFWELKLHPWDYAAGWLMIEEAGGKMTRFDGSPFQMGDRSVLASNGHIHSAMVDVLRGR